MNPPPTPPQPLRIFLASPSADTLEARAAVAAAVRSVAVDARYQHVDLQLLRWDDPERPPVCSNLHNPQQDIVAQVGRPGDCDLLIALFAHTMGGLLTEARFGRSPAGRPWHCTEWEVAQARAGAAQGRVRDVWVYREHSDPPAATKSMCTEQRRAIAADDLAVCAYFDSFKSDAHTLERGFNLYTTPQDLQGRLTDQLRAWINRVVPLGGPSARVGHDTGTAAPLQADHLHAGQQALLAQVQRGSLETTPHATVNAVLHEPVSGTQSYLLRRCAQWCTGDGGRLDRRFVNLTLLLDRGLQAEGERFVPDARHAKEGRYDNLAEMLAQHADVAAWVLVGDPGAGKSTLLQHHELRTAEAALRAINAQRPVPASTASAASPSSRARNASSAPPVLPAAPAPTAPPAALISAPVAAPLPELPELCIWHRLSEYSCASPEPEQWLRERWAAHYPLLPPLHELRRSFRLRFLLDGLNEISAPDRESQLEAIDRWPAWVASAAGTMLPPLFSVRTLAQSPLGGAGLEVRQATLARWTAEQVERYCAVVLGPGNGLWPEIKDDGDLLELSRTPFFLAAQCELYVQRGQAARERAELLGGIVWLALRREWRALKAVHPTALLGLHDQALLAGDKWSAALKALPEQGALVPGLDALAFSMQRDGREVSVPRSELLARVQLELDSRSGTAAALRTTASAPARAAGTTQARKAGAAGPRAAASAPALTAEQWLQAAQGLGLLGEGDIDPYTGEAAWRFVHQLWQEFFAARALRTWPARAPADAAPPATATASTAAAATLHWGLFSPPTLAPMNEVLQRLSPGEPLPGPDTSHWEEPVKLALQMCADPLPWLRGLQAHHLPLAGRAAKAVLVRAEAQPGGASVIHALRAALLARSLDPQCELRLRIEAAEALGALGDPRCEAMRGPQGQRVLLPREALWIPIPAGRYVIGTAEGGDADEQPPTPVTLRAFTMAFAPVTNAEFACFVDDRGYEDERWWVGAAAQRWWRGEWRNESEIDRWGKIFADLRRDATATMARFPSLTEASREQWLEIAEMSEADTQAMLEGMYGAQRHRLPQEWHNPRFNQPTQPVVGVSLFEAEAYVRWLAAMTGRPLALPTEAQWEAAARGLEGRRWPWAAGHEGPGPLQINADPAHLRRTSPVGAFPGAGTAQGLVDMAGNVWQWTSSAYTDRLDARALTRPTEDESSRRAVRGGSWDFLAGHCRAGCRGRDDPDDRFNDLGFRVVCCPILEP